jgi:thiamine-phosphate pyrophosphorylase
MAPFPALYAILDPTLVAEPLAFARKLADAGVQLIQLRDKRASSRKFYEQSKALVEALAAAGVKVVVNDRPDIAAIVGAAGVHVGQDDLSVEDARKICKAPSWVGVSTHNLDQFRTAQLSSADYIAVGPIFATASKENPDPVVGLDFIRRVRQLTRKPLVAIGGITIETVASVYEAGADSVAVIRDLAAAADPAAQAGKYLAVAERVRFARS